MSFPFWAATGAGSSATAELMAGATPPVFTPAVVTVLPAALNYDGETRSFTGPIHPVDQQVQMLLCIEQGSVPALGKVGQRYRKRFLGVPQSKIAAVAADETNVALAALIRRGDIEIRSVTVLSSSPGSNVVVVAYTNLRNPIIAQRKQSASTVA